MRSILFFSSVAILAKWTLAQSDVCYFANGTALPDNPIYDEYKPCASGGPSTICCGVNRKNPSGGNDTDGNTMDECLPNGLCQNRVTVAGVETTKFFVDFCADSNIGSGNCLNVCDQVRGPLGVARITPCSLGRADSERWCCGDSTTCCTSNVGVVSLAQVMGGGTLSSSIPSAASSATSAAASKTSSKAAASATPNSVLASTVSSASGTGVSATASSSAAEEKEKSSGLSGGAIAGIVIGAVAGLALLAAAIFFARRASKYKKQANVSRYAEAPSGHPMQHPDDGYISADSEKYAQQSQHTQRSVHQTSPAELPLAQPSELATGDESSKPALQKQ